MKRNFLYLFVSILSLTSCSLNNNNDEIDNTVYRIEYHLINSEAFDGTEANFETDEIVWIFNDEDKTVTVDNTNTDEDDEDGLDSGIYTVDYSSNQSYNFIIIDGDEFGAYGLNQTSLLINQTITSTDETNEDGYIYTFRSVLVPIE
ncbi:MAG: hypothetical protein ACK5MZ_03030 [Aestuariibaculum sp.]